MLQLAGMELILKALYIVVYSSTFTITSFFADVLTCIHILIYKETIPVGSRVKREVYAEMLNKESTLGKWIFYNSSFILILILIGKENNLT